MSKKPVVLVVDDDKWFADFLGDTLKNIATIKIVNDTNEVFDAIDKFQPKLLLLDFALGEQNALAILNELISYSDIKLRVYLISSLANHFNAGDLQKLGVEQLLDKSKITPNKLRKLVEWGVK